MEDIKYLRIWDNKGFYETLKLSRESANKLIIMLDLHNVPWDCEESEEDLSNEI